MSDNYCYQKFFNLLDSESIELKKNYYKQDSKISLTEYIVRRDLFDSPSSKLTRSIKISWLDIHIDTETDFKKLLHQLQDVGTIVIINDQPKCSNLIYKDYSDEMLRCYIKAFQDNGIHCFWSKP